MVQRVRCMGVCIFVFASRARFCESRISNYPSRRSRIHATHHLCATLYSISRPLECAGRGAMGLGKSQSFPAVGSWRSASSESVGGSKAASSESVGGSKDSVAYVLRFNIPRPTLKCGYTFWGAAKDLHTLLACLCGTRQA